jgi:competence protein ComEC
MPRTGTCLVAAALAGTAAGVCSGARSGELAAAAIAAAAVSCAPCPRRLRPYLVCVAIGAAAGAWGARARDHALAPPLLTWFDRASEGSTRHPQPVMVEGVLRTDAALAAGGVRLSIDVTAVDSGAGRLRLAGPVQAQVAGDLALDRLSEWTAGRSVRVPVTLRRPQMARNFGGQSPRLQALRRPFVLLGSIKSAALVEAHRGTWAHEVAAALRRHVRGMVTRHVHPRAPDGAPIVTAILIGDRAGLTEDVELRLQKAGVYHVIAISGGNVALLTAITFAVLRWIFRSARVASVTALAVVLGYGWVVGGDPSVARAVTAAAIYLTLGLTALRATALSILQTAALVLTIIDPLMVIDAGAWLSFGATAGIVVLARRCADTLLGESAYGASRWPLRWVTLAVAATLAAEAVVLPLGAQIFMRVSVAGVVLNLLALPAMAVVQIAGFIAAIADPLAPILTRAAAAVAGSAAEAMLDGCRLADYWSGLSWRVPPPSVWWLATYYLAGGTLLVVERKWRWVAASAAIISLAIILAAPGVEHAGPRSDRLRLAVLDVGQGDAVLLQMPRGHSLLVDAGGGPGAFDIGSRIVTPAAWALGVRRLNWLAISHGDRDHAGGAASVMRDLAPAEVWEGVPVPPDVERARLRRLADARGIPWRTLFAGARLELGPVTVEAVHPRPPEWERQRVRNDDSIVLRVRYGKVELWLTGDAGAEFERRLPPEADAARVRILKVGHHGSRTSTSPDLLSRLRPQIAIVSAGRNNLFGHPAPEVVARLAAAGATVFRTDDDGAVIVETDGEVAFVRTVSGRSWLVGAPGA